MTTKDDIKKLSKSKWTTTCRGNETLAKKWGYISYNHSIGKNDEISKKIDKLGCLIADMVGKEDFTFSLDKEETAIYVKGDKGFKFQTKFYILNGDFRKELEKCDTLDSALAIFMKNKDKQSCWSNY